MSFSFTTSVNVNWPEYVRSVGTYATPTCLNFETNGDLVLKFLGSLFF